MNSANKAIWYVEVINIYSLRELFNSTPVHNTHRNGTYVIGLTDITNIVVS